MGPLKAMLKELWMDERPPPPPPGQKPKKKIAKDKRIETINRTIKAWESFKPKTIRSAFNKALLTNF
ncbi:unnamed protein product [Phytophthora fragariaefolia]|uniref:Unnamed protein product n=1 Tax=Phytophthora fragariaefolia TaxID=1490495 RepID=A0A9W7DA14_9STRA|nr:unnamed protein product [Phytophthora fragariaefolia]GMF60298.1 unnamed protein product [Phytophthora fragariaefolia]